MLKTSISTQEIIRNILLQVAIETLSMQNKGWDADKISNEIANHAVDKTRLICYRIEKECEERFNQK